MVLGQLESDPNSPDSRKEFVNRVPLKSVNGFFKVELDNGIGVNKCFCGDTEDFDPPTTRNNILNRI